tara:strand:+ start:1224 stop:1670 length:447 start_codon:yes stop_codon:yes gene_type:complete
MLPKETLKELELINYDINDKYDGLYGFKYETNGWYECITFNEVVLWDSEDNQGWLSERPDFDGDTMEDDHDDDIIGCIKRRFNKHINILKSCRYDVPSVESLNSEDIVHEILEDISDRSGLGNAWESIDDETQDEIIQKWVHIIEKHS